MSDLTEAFLSLKRLTLIFWPTREADFDEFYGTVCSWNAAGIHVRDIVDYIESFRFNTQKTGRLLCNIDLALASIMQLRAAAHNAKVQPTFSAGTRYPPGAEKKTQNSQAPIFSEKQRIMQEARQKQFCGRFQTGSCSITDASHIIKSRDGEISVAHKCIKCGLSHALFKCPQYSHN
jgi:hypothetical protein